MLRVSSLLCAGALAWLGCAGHDASEDDVGSAPPANSCVRIDGGDIGQRVTVEVPGIDSAMPVTFTSWIAKEGEPNTLVGFTLDVNATFTVTAGQDIFEGSGVSFANPNGLSSPAANGISSVEICTAVEDTSPPPSVDPPACEHDCDGGGGDAGTGDAGHCP